jgi:hypothetical protein
MSDRLPWSDLKSDPLGDVNQAIKDAEALDKRQRECEHPFDAIEHIQVSPNHEQVVCRSCHKSLYFHVVEPD